LPAKTTKKVTPALKQYLELKEQYKDAILMFRMGDFYEMFFEDAEVAAKELEIALTKRSFGKGGEKAPMCGIPYHALENYLAKLVRKGYKVAICEQLEEPKPGKKVVKRGVVRVVTPGTYFEDETEDRFLMAVYPHGKKFSVSWAELSSGDFYFTTVEEDELRSLLNKFSPKEVLLPEGVELPLIKKELPAATVQESPYFVPQEVKESLENPTKGELKAINALLNFVKETQLEFAPKLKPPKRYTGNRFVYLDPHTQKNLELVEPALGAPPNATLFGVLNKTKTGMGRRLLRFWILHPLKSVDEINKRLDAVEELKGSFFVADELREELSKVYDLERLTTKVTAGVANPKEVASLRNSLRNLPKIKELLKEFSSQLLREITENFDDLYDVYCELERVLVENPPFSPKEGGIIKSGVHRELDHLREIKENGEKFIKEIEEKERKRTGIQSLKVGFNNVFGYYIEVSKPNLHLIPPDYVRKQTLVNAERFITPELKEFEEKVLSAQERIELIEYELFKNLRKFLTERADRILNTAEKLAQIDALLSLAKAAQEYGYCRPQVGNFYEIEIEEGRHPVLERQLEEEFIPNDGKLNREQFILLITGPNMGGKSVFLRQTALITAMAQMGSFVPASRAKIGVVDRIFTRVGAADNLSKGLSTFMMEMVETANILKHATEKSLIVLDEIGRGTSTYDGMSIAQAVVEFISSELGAKTLFATHYHELTELEGRVKGVKNYHAAVEEVGGKIVFTHKIVDGPSEKSYGIHVAELAGLPPQVVERAKEILNSLEKRKTPETKEVQKKASYNPQIEAPLFKVAQKVQNNYSASPKGEKRKEGAAGQLSEEAKALLQKIAAVEISTTTPLEALLTLAKLKEEAKKLITS